MKSAVSCGMEIEGKIGMEIVGGNELRMKDCSEIVGKRQVDVAITHLQYRHGVCP